MKQTPLPMRRLKYEPAESKTITVSTRTYLCTSINFALMGDSSIEDLQEVAIDNSFWE